jgi:hypothetical protein
MGPGGLAMKENSDISWRETLDRSALNERIEYVLNALNDVSLAASSGRYHDAYKACGEAEELLNKVATECFNLDEEYNNE